MSARSSLTFRRLAKAFAIVLLAVAGQVVWHNTLEDRFVPKRFVELEEGRLFRSGQLSRHLVRRVLEEHDIKVVIDLNSYEEKWLADQKAEERVTADLGITHYRMPLRGDGTGDVETYAQVLTRIRHSIDAGESILVHCAAGARRTGGVVAAYQLLVEHKSKESAYRELSRYGNATHESTLLAYVNEILPELADRLVALGTIDAAPATIPRLQPEPRGLAGWFASEPAPQSVPAVPN